jgi:hypothetical protein
VPGSSLDNPAFGTPLLVHLNALITVLREPSEGIEMQQDVRLQLLDRPLTRERQEMGSLSEGRQTRRFAEEVADRAVAAGILVGAEDEQGAARATSRTASDGRSRSGKTGNRPFGYSKAKSGISPPRPS